MKKIMRVYVPDQKTGVEKSITEPDEIAKILSKPKADLDLDYDVGQNFKMGTSKELIGQTVIVGDLEMVIPEH
jgi:hypothetical protein